MFLRLRQALATLGLAAMFSDHGDDGDHARSQSFTSTSNSVRPSSTSTFGAISFF